MLYNHCKTDRYLILSALFLLVASFFVLLFFRGFFDPDEGRYSEIPREMIERGNWMEMRMLGYRYYEKPPFAYWAVAPAICLFGAHDWAVRVPLLVTAVLIIAMFFFSMRRQWSPSTVFVTILVAVSTAGFMAGSCILLTDAFLVLWFTAACLCLYRAFETGATPRGRQIYLFMAAFSMVSGFLTKGAVSVVLPVGIVLIWLLWEKRLSAILTPSVLLAGALFFILSLPVLLLINGHNPGFLHQFIFEEHVARFMGTRASQLHAEPFWFYIEVIPALLLPWTLFVIRAVRNAAKKHSAPEDTFSRFLLVWVLVVVVFFSASRGKLMSYIMPAIPPLGILVGRWGVAQPPDENAIDKKLWLLGYAGSIIVALALAAVWAISFFQFMPKSIYPIAGISIMAFLPLAVALIMLVRSCRFRVFPGLMLFNSALMLTSALLISPIAGKDFNVLIHINSSFVYKSLASLLKPEDTIVVFWDYRPALPFYTRRLYIPFQVKNELGYGMKLEPERQGDIRNVDELQSALQQCQGRIFALVAPKDYTTKFLPLGLHHTHTALPHDPDTLVLELLKKLAVRSQDR